MLVENENKRTKIWRIVILVSTLIIILTSILLVTKMFTTNPITGEWIMDDGTLYLDVDSNRALVTLAEDNETLEYDYELSRGDKEIRFTKRENSDSSQLELLDASFNYSIDGEVLTLIEREYGEQFVFVKHE